MFQNRIVISIFRQDVVRLILSQNGQTSFIAIRIFALSALSYYLDSRNIRGPNVFSKEMISVLTNLIAYLTNEGRGY